MVPPEGGGKSRSPERSDAGRARRGVRLPSLLRVGLADREEVGGQQQVPVSITVTGKSRWPEAPRGWRLQVTVTQIDVSPSFLSLRVPSSSGLSEHPITGLVFHRACVRAKYPHSRSRPRGFLTLWARESALPSARLSS